MIVLDTHIWVWWVHGDNKLPPEHKAYIQDNESAGLGVSAISCWEVAKLVEYNRLSLPIPVGDWLDQALAYPGVRLLELTPRIAVESTQLPGTFHRDLPIKSSWQPLASLIVPWSLSTKRFSAINMYG